MAIAPLSKGDQADSEQVRYCTIIEEYEKEYESWEERAKKITERYRDEQESSRDRSSARRTKRRYNLFWSNTQTKKSALYGKDPKPYCERRNDQKDQVSRGACQALESLIGYQMNCGSKFGPVMKKCVLDCLLGGRGTAWVRFEPHFRDIPDSSLSNDEDDDESEDSEQKPQEIAYAEVAFDYVHWRDFGHNIARSWEEVCQVWRICYKSREELIKRFGPQTGANIPLDHSAKVGNEDKADLPEGQRRATIYEIWDKSSKERIYLHKDMSELLERMPDPMDFEGFFPCPRPLYSGLTNDSLVPLPDYAQYQDQCAELDRLTQRIESLSRQLQLKGVYDGSKAGLEKLLDSSTDGTLIPIANWESFVKDGGISGGISWMPIEVIAAVLLQLYEARDKVKQEIYEISGMSDILRGVSDPRETATAQQIKSSFAQGRLKEAQGDVQEFARELLRLAGDVICKHFPPNVIEMTSGLQFPHEAQIQQIKLLQQQGMPLPPDAHSMLSQPTWESIIALLKNEEQREIQVNIETDSTILQDEEQDKRSRLEFMQTIGQFLAPALQSMQEYPATASLIKESIMFVIRGFRIGRPLEGLFEETLEQLVNQVNSQPSQSQQLQQSKSGEGNAAPDPQIELKKIQMQAQADMQLEQIKAQNQAQLKQMEIDGKAAIAKLQEEYKLQAKSMELSLNQQMREREMTMNAYQNEQERTQRMQIESAKQIGGEGNGQDSNS